MASKPSQVDGHPFLARGTESAALGRLLAAAEESRGGTLVVCGEPGIGKTELLERALLGAAGLWRLRAVGREFEMELPFTALYELCRPLLDRVEPLPRPQRNALEVAFALRDGPAPDRFRVGLAVLKLLSDAARGRGLACVIDDAQWLDHASAQVLAFVARQVEEQPVAFLVGLRDPGNFAGLPTLTLAGLGDDDAHALLASQIRAPLDEQVRDRIVAEARGNPLALLELPRSAGPADLAGGFGLPDTASVPERIEASYQARMDGLPAATRRLLLVAAAEPLGDPLLLWGAAERFGIGDEAALPAEQAGLLDVSIRVRFRHSLVRSAVYRTASLEERRLVHRALAAVTDPELDPDRRAWHRAQSVLAPDEEVAEELQRSAARARSRGGVAAAAAFWARATLLTPDRGRRAVRALTAARLKHQAGAAEAASVLLATARTGPLDGRLDAQAELLSAQLAAHVGRGAEAPALLLAAAKRLEAHDRPMARETYLEALVAAMWAGRLGNGLLEATARAASAATPPEGTARPLDLLLDGLVRQVTQGHTAAVALMRQAVDAFLAGPCGDEDDSRWLWLACCAATDLWDDMAWHTLSDRQVQLARRSGALTALPVALHYRSLAHIHAGEFAEAAALVREACAIEEAGGTAGVSCADLALRAWRGEEARTSAVIETSLDVTRARGKGRTLTAIDYASAILNNGIGRYESALRVCLAACEQDEPGFHSFIPPELVEAAVRCGRPAVAVPIVELLTERTQASGTDWALGIQFRSRALITDGPAADDLYRAAIERLERGRARIHLARAHLVYGEWLHRKRKRREARLHLRTAYDELTTIGAAGFAARAARELSAAGEQPRRTSSSASPSELLTAQEIRIAQIVAAGATSKEAAQYLFLSQRTIDAHLRNVFKKLGLTSRRQLRDLRLPHNGESGF